MFGSRRSLRRWASRVLLLWCFGIAVGVVHACALQTADHHHDAPPETISAHAATHHGHGGAPEDEEGAQANCLDFCDKLSVSTPSCKYTPDVSGSVQPIALLSGQPAALVDEPARISGRSNGTFERRGVGPPLRISLLRLAL